MQLLDFQTDALHNITRTLRQNSSVLLQSATASGKTVIASQYIQQCVTNKLNVLVLVNLQVLVGQFDATLEAFGVDASVLHDEITRDKNGNLFTQDWNNQVQITMPITLINTINGQNKLSYDNKWKPDIIVIDEAHKGTSLYYQTIRDQFPNAKILGLTATPYREQNEDGEHLTEWYGDRLITTISVRDLIKLGRLVQPEYFQLDSDDHIVNTWLDLAKDKPTIIFTKDTAHSLYIKAAFEKAGIPTGLVTSGSDVNPDQIVASQTPLQRQSMFNDFENGVYKVLVSVNALCEGFDCPIAEVVMLARTVGNHALYHQMIGRVLRAFKGKISALIIDFYNNITTHGHIEDYEWSLIAEENDSMYVQKERNVGLETYNKKSSVYYVCHECNHVYDIKKKSSCKHCLSKCKVQIITTGFDLLRKHFEIKDNKDFNLFRTRFQGAMSVPEAQKGFNLRTKQVVFDNSKLSEEFNYMPKLFETVKNGGDTFVVEI